MNSADAGADGTESGLAELAFGDPPQIAPPWLPGLRPAGPRASWLAGVALGAAGRYAAAMAVLVPVTAGTDRVYASLAASTVASHRRQLGAHQEARRWDSFGLSRLSGVSSAEGAMEDALLGLAADAIGAGELDRCTRLLRTVHSRGTMTHWRSRIRAGWVATERLLAHGERAAALTEATRTREYAGSSHSQRHITKSDMLRATCLTIQRTERERQSGARLAEQVLEISLDRGFISLVWPTALLLSDVQPDCRERWISLARTSLSSIIGYADPQLRELTGHSPWMPQWLLHPGEANTTVDTSEF